MCSPPAGIISGTGSYAFGKTSHQLNHYSFRLPLLEKHLLVKKSTLPQAGKGLFTRINIAKGMRIVEYKGRIQPWRDVKDQDGINGYLMYINRNVVINALPAIKTFGRYANDARGLSRVKGVRNNSEYVSEGKRCFIEATRNIRAGEEILVHYGRAYWALIKKIRKKSMVS
jgi:SET domain-containing protein